MKTTIKQHLKRWLQKADQQDQALSQHKRKIKWIGILGTLFTLYILSFMIPHVSLKHFSLITQNREEIQDSLSKDSTVLSNSTFELPVDSFEQLLNVQIHERADQKQ